MPIYEYKCTGCGNVFDGYKKMSEDKEEEICPTCGGNALKVRISLFSTFGRGLKGGSCGSSGSPFG